MTGVPGAHATLQLFQVGRERLPEPKLQKLKAFWNSSSDDCGGSVEHHEYLAKNSEFEEVVIDPTKIAELKTIQTAYNQLSAKNSRVRRDNVTMRDSIIQLSEGCA
jgi:hypothetical protein